MVEPYGACDTADNRTFPAFLAELICTFIFILINMIFLRGRYAPTGDHGLISLTIAGALIGQIYTLRHVGGASFNPAVTFALHMNAKRTLDDPSQLATVEHYQWIYYVAPFLGGFLTGPFMDWHESNIKRIQGRAFKQDMRKSQRK